MLADLETPSPPVTLHQLAGGWQLGDPWAVAALVLQVASLAWYGAGMARLRRRGRSWPAGRAASFGAGVACLCVALVSGLASYDDSVFTAHVMQHLLLMMVAPPLLALGAPVTLAIQASPRSAQTAFVRLVHSRVVGVLTLPLVAAALYYGAMYAGFLTSLYPYALTHSLAHHLEHLAIFAVGCLFWWPMVATDELPHRPAYPLRILAMFVGMPFEVFLGVAVMNFSRPIAPEHTLSDTHTGGAVFWVASMAITFLAALVMVAQWMRAEERQAVREDRRAAAREARRVQTWEAARAAKGAPVKDL